MDIPSEWAQTIAALVDEGTFDAAARRLHITASAVSQRVKALEERLGRVVVLRSKPVRPTPAGEAIVRLARQLALLQHETLIDLGENPDQPITIPLAINADSLATWFLPPLVKVARQYPVAYQLHRDDQDATASLLETGAVMGAVTSQATAVSGCRVHALGAMRYEAVAAAEFARRWFADRVTPESLGRAPVVDFDRRDELQTRWLRRRGADPALPPRHQIPASSDFADAVRFGLGWALLPRFQSQHGLQDGSLVLLGGDPVDVPLFWQQWNLRSPLLDAIATALTEEASRVLSTP